MVSSPSPRDFRGEGRGAAPANALGLAPTGEQAGRSRPACARPRCPAPKLPAANGVDEHVASRPHHARARAWQVAASVVALALTLWAGPHGRGLAQAIDPYRVEVVQTSANLSQRLTPLPSFDFGRAGHAPGRVIRIDAAARRQRVAGFGAAMTDTSAWLMEKDLAPAARQALMSDFFGSGGIHLNFIRVPIGASDFTRTGRPYTYDDVPAGQTDPALTQFSIAHDGPYILPALRQMLAVNPQTTVMATPWTAPPWMKANDAYDDKSMAGSLNSSAYQPFADYFVKFLQGYAAAGVPVGAIAPENEPDSGAAFPAMNFTPSGEAQWITQNLEPSLQAANLHPRLYGGDVGWAGPYYPNDLETSQAAGTLT